MRAALLTIALCAASTGCDSLGLGDDATTYSGDFSGSLVYTTTGRVSCHTMFTVTGTVDVQLDQTGDVVTGEGEVSVRETAVSWDPPPCGGPAPNRRWDGTADITGSAANFQFSHENIASGAIALTTTTSFTGSLAGGAINGVVTINHSGKGVIAPPDTTRDAGLGTFNVTLR
jgi:hypothetical protein